MEQSKALYTNEKPVEGIENSSFKGIRALGTTNNKDRPGFNRWDWYEHRQEDRLPEEIHDIIGTCQNFYRRIGIVRNVIDMMADFASEGLELQHNVKSQERFYKEWAKKVDLQSRVHDFMKLLLRDGNVIVRRKEATVTKKIQKKMSKASFRVNRFTMDGPSDPTELGTIIEKIPRETPDKVKQLGPDVEKRTIPWQYIFLNPVVIEKIGGRVGRFVGSDDVGIILSQKFIDRIKKPKTKSEKSMIDKIPQEILSAIKRHRASSSNIIALNMDKVYIDYYKKDDWEDWGTPFLYAVIEDILFKEKMRLADMAALDGVINVVRVWKLGDHEKNIFPTATATNKLLEILQYNTGGGITDIVWDSMIDYQVDYPPVDKILGPAKYDSVNSDIVRGLGIPDSLLGGSELSTRNAETAFIQLKTLVERLEYIRMRTKIWLETELTIVANAMGFERIPSINFANMSLRDEAAEKDLIIKLVERGLLSIQSLHEAFGNDFMIEFSRLREEEKLREKYNPVLEKADPYHVPFSQLEKQHKMTMEQLALKGVGGGPNMSGDQPRDNSNNQPGRPPQTRDVGPRDRRTTKVLSVYKSIAEDFMCSIDEVMDSLYLKDKKVKNLRLLSSKDKIELSAIKQNILANLNPDSIVSIDNIGKIIQDNSSVSVSELKNIFNELVLEKQRISNKAVNVREKRSLLASAWAIMKTELNKEEEVDVTD